MFGDNSSGFANENEIMDYLNTTKQFERLNPSFKSFLSFAFKENLNGKTIVVHKTSGQVKPDIIISAVEHLMQHIISI